MQIKFNVIITHMFTKRGFDNGKEKSKSFSGIAEFAVKNENLSIYSVQVSQRLFNKKIKNSCFLF